MAFSTITHFPASYPNEVPTSLPAISSDIEADTSDDDYMLSGDDAYLSDSLINPSLLEQAGFVSTSETSQPTTCSSLVFSVNGALSDGVLTSHYSHA